MANRNEYDVTLENSSITQGLKLAKQGEAPMWSVSMPARLVEQQFQGEADFSALAPEKETIIYQSDWRKGFGQFVFKDPQRYSHALGCDARWEGMVTLQPLVTTSVVQTQLANVGFEAGALTSWTISGATPAISTAQAHAGTYSAKITGNGDYLEQSPTWVAALFQSCSITLTAWAWCDTASRARIQIADSVGNTFSDYHTGGSTWEQLTVTRVVNAAATSLAFRLYCSGGTANAYFDDVDWTFQSMTAPTIKFLEFNSNWYCLTTTALYEWDNGNAYWTPQRYRLGATETFTDMGVYDGNLYLAKGTSVAYEYSADADAWTVSNLAGDALYADYFANNANNFWKSRANTVNVSTNPINGGSWGTEVEVVDTSATINSLFAHRSYVFVGTTKGLYWIDETKTPDAPVLWIKTIPYTNNFKAVLTTQDRQLVFNYGLRGLYMADETSEWAIRDISPSLYGSRMPDFGRRVLALAEDENWLYAFMQGQSADNQSYILAGRYENVDGVILWVWHPIARTDIDDLRAAGVCYLQTATGRLWFGGQETNQSNRNRPSYCLLPALVPPTDDSAYRYDTGADNYFFTGWFYSGFSVYDKAWLSLTLLSKGLSSTNRTCAIHWQKDGDTSWTSLGTFDTSPSQTKYFAADTYGKRIRFRLTPYTDNSANAVEIHSFTVTGVLRITAKRVFDFTVVVPGRTRGGSPDSKNPNDILSDLETLRTAQWPITLYRYEDRKKTADTTYNVVILSLEENAKREASGSLERWYRIVAQEVTIS